MATAPTAAPPRADDDYGSPERSEWLDVDWREHMHWVRAHDGWVNVVDYGAGEATPVVLVHGLSGCWQNWLENIPALGRTRRVVAVDLPGFGSSHMPEAQITVDWYASVVDDVCEQLGITKAAVIGNSLGGFIAADLAIHHDTRVERIVLVGAAGLSSRYIGGLFGIRALRSAQLGRLAHLSNAALARRRVEEDPLFRRPRSRRLGTRLVAHRPERLSKEIVFEMARGTGRPAFGSAVGALGSYDFRHLVARIRCPTLIIAGEKDLVVPPTAADEYARLVPHARKVMFEDTGHVPMVERPGRFNALVLEFLDEPGDAPPQ